MTIGIMKIGTIIGLAALAAPVAAQPPKPTTEAVAFLDGVWIGPAEMTLPNGDVSRFEQMERVGPMMGGEIRIMEGKGRGGDGKTLFNALSVLSQEPDGGIMMRSYTMGHDSSRSLKIDGAGGFGWEMQAGPARMRYTATVKDGVWDEVGERIGPDGKAVRFFHMRLKRVGDTDWPAANPAFPTRP